MTRIAAIAALFLAVGSPFPASAEDFGKTTWGMKLARVRKLYPGGAVAKDESGVTIYSVQQRFGPIKDARIVFEFPGGEPLNGVTVRFPRPGIPTDPKATDFAIMTNGQATEVFTSLRKYLGKKYGKPSDERVSWIGERASILLQWDVHGTPGSLIWLKREPLEEAEDLTDVTLEYIDGDVYGYPEDKSPPADCSATPLTYTSMKKIERDRECAIGKTGEQVCRLDQVDSGSVKIACDEGVYWLSADPADVPRLGAVKPGQRYLFTFRVMECSFAEIALKFMDAKPAR
jgi:hypothetical protein